MFHEYPYTNFHELNLDWIIKQIKKLTGVVANVADWVAVMYAGKIVEYGTAEEIFYEPAHPYTWALLSSMPDLHTTGKMDSIPGTPPDLHYPPKGDAFAPRNKYALDIDFDSIPLRAIQPNRNKEEIHLIAVAEIHFWHGFDRLIHGLGKYYQGNPTLSVYLHLLGDFFGEREKEEILTPIQTYELEKYVICYGNQSGEALNNIFNQCDYAIGSLARHRSGITHIKTLKNREYAARGFGFIYSETDDDFEQMPYILKVPADETPIDIKQLISFYQNQTLSPQEIRDSIQHLSWKEQMKKVITSL